MFPKCSLNDAECSLGAMTNWAQILNYPEVQKRKEIEEGELVKLLGQMSLSRALASVHRQMDIQVIHHA